MGRSDETFISYLGNECKGEYSEHVMLFFNFIFVALELNLVGEDQPSK